jgi:hypothetical protein
MKAVLLDNPSAAPRPHPYEGSEHDPRASYYNFREHPELIPSALETFVPWQGYKAVQDFYRFLAWVNGSDSILESNDSGITQIQPSYRMRGELSQFGRVMLLQRSLINNLSVHKNGFLLQRFLHHLSNLEPQFSMGECEVTLAWMYVKALPGPDRTDVQEEAEHYLRGVRPRPGDKLGEQVQINWRAFGSYQESVMKNLETVIAVLYQATVYASEELGRGRRQ